MALDEALLESADREGLCTIRLYAWDPATLSFGRNEPARRRYDRDAIARRGMATVRRPTGGRAVWHDREVTYAVAAPATTFGSLRDTYLEIHTMLADALRSLGAAVVLAKGRPATAVGAGACFAAAAGGEVMTTGGRKIVGSAQVRRGGAFLQHGSILLAAEQDAVSAVTLGPADPPSATGVGELVGPGRATWDTVSAAVAQAASRRWNAGPQVGALPDAVRRRAEARLAQFEDEHWTWRR
jgi:lipoate-protein ligase A